MTLQNDDSNHADTHYTFSLNGTDFAVGGENSSQDPDNCIYIQDVQGNDTFDFHLIRQGLTISLNENGGSSYVTDLEYGPEATIICDSVIENVIGGRANDYIKGNEFANQINGGKGGDHLDGCGGSDTFVYRGIAASKAAPGLFDTIENFSAGEDFINLRKIDANHQVGGNQHFTFIGANAFSHTAGELRLTNHNVLLGDVNGDGHADLKIVVHGDHVGGGDIFL